MKPQELRVGNCINAEISNGEETIEISNGKITGILQDSVYINEIKFPYESLRAIPITHDQLLKLGFYSDVLFEGDSPVYILKDKEFYIDFNTLQPMEAGFPIAKYKIEYVHQLQNLYYALRNEELTVPALNS